MNNKIKVLTLLLLLYIFCRCTISSTTGQTDRVRDNKGEMTVLLDSVSLSKRAFYRILHFQEVNKHQVIVEDSIRVAVEKVLNSYREDGVVEGILETDWYNIQVVPYLSTEGSAYIWVNCFCSEKSYWREEIVTVIDGGPCYFNFYIDPNGYKILRSYINGN